MDEFLKRLLPIIGTILVFGIPLFALYLGLYSSKAKHKENMELIRQGIIPPKPNKNRKPTPNKFRSLRNGMLCVGIGLGIIVDMIFYKCLWLTKKDNFLFLGASILLFMGLAYIIYFLIVRNREDINDESDYE